MKKIFLIGLVLLNVLSLSAQRYQVKKEKNQLYILHKVEAKETLFSLARLYNLSHRDIAVLNKLDANAGLNIGQQLKIPLNKNNFIQSGQKQKGYEPVYHTVTKGENLYKLSRHYNSVKESQLKKWNKLLKNTVKAGQDIIVGYVKVNPAKPEVKKEIAVATATQKKDTATVGVAEEEKASITETPVEKKQPPVEETNVFVGNSEDPEGYFADQFAVSNASAQPKILNGTAATFKSTSGWGDRKYYILINDIPAGTIVKVNANNKTIYAKVLESLPALRDNKEIICRLSNASASALGISDAKFEVELYYSE